MNFVSQRRIDAAALFVRGECTQILFLGRRVIDIVAIGEWRLVLDNNSNVAIVTKLVEKKTTPVTSRRRGTRAVIVGIQQSNAVRCEPGSDGVVVNRSHNDRMPNGTNDMDSPPDAIVDLTPLA